MAGEEAEIYLFYNFQTRNFAYISLTNYLLCSKNICSTKHKTSQKLKKCHFSWDKIKEN